MTMMLVPRTLFATLATLATLAWAGCSAAPPPAVAPEPEVEAELEAEAEPAPERPEIPLEERIRAPFAVLSEGSTAPREPRREPVARDAGERGTPTRVPAGAAGAENGAAGADAAAAPSADAAAPTARPAAPAPREPAPRQHTVEVGDTFYGIARRYGVTPAALTAVNPGVDNERLRAGQVLQLPAYATRAPADRDARPAADPPTVQAPANDYPAEAQPAPAGRERTHRVEAGDTLWSIARRYGVSIDRIRTANRLTDDTVRIGQALVIP